MSIINFPQPNTANDAVQVFTSEVRAYNSTSDELATLHVSTVLDSNQSVVGVMTDGGYLTFTYEQAVALRDALDAALAAGYPNGGRVA